MNGFLSVSVVLKDDWVEKVCEFLIGIKGSSIDTDSRIEVFASREDASLEGYTESISLIFVLIKDCWGAVLAHK